MKVSNKTMAVQELEKLLTFKEAMAYLRVSRSTLYRLIDAGLPAHKVGAHWRFYPSELEQAVQGVTTEQGEEKP